MPCIVGSKVEDYIFKLNNSTLALKVFATIGGLAARKLKDNEFAIVTNDPTLRHIVWFDNFTYYVKIG